MEENKYRQEHEPKRPLIEIRDAAAKDEGDMKIFEGKAINIEAKVREALAKMQGVVTVIEIAQEAGLKELWVRDLDLVPMVEDENQKRTGQHDKKPVLLHGKDPTTILKRALTKLEGVVSQEQVGYLLGISKQVLSKTGFYQLVEEENSRRQREEPERKMLEFIRDRYVDPENTIRTALKDMEGLVNGPLIAHRTGIPAYSLAYYKWRQLIEDENRRRKEEKPERPLIKVRVPVKIDKDSKGKVIAALKNMEGVVRPSALAEKTGLTLSIVHNLDYKTLVKQENDRRAAEETDRKPLQVLEEIKKPLDTLTDVLRTIEGETTREDIISKLGIIGSWPLDAYNYKKLIEEENNRRINETPKRVLIKLVERGMPVEARIKMVKNALRSMTAGRVTQPMIIKAAQIASLSGISIRDYIVEENRLRREKEPERYLLSFQPATDEEAIRYALMRYEGKMSKDSFSRAIGLKGSPVIESQKFGMFIDQENERRVNENTRQKPIMYRALNMNPRQSVVDTLRKYVEGPLTIKRLAELADVSEQTVADMNWRPLVDEENQMRKIEGRPEIKIYQKKTNRNAVASIINALRSLDGLVTMQVLEKAADVNYVTLYNKNWKELVAKENERRAIAEPQRSLLVLINSKENPVRLKAGKLKINEGIAQVILAMRDSSRDAIIETLSALYGDKYSRSEIERFIDRINSDGAMVSNKDGEKRKDANAEYHARQLQAGNEKIKEALKRMNGVVNARSIGREAGMFHTVVHNRDWRALVESENLRRQAEEAQRGKLFIYGADRTQDIMNLLRNMDGRVSAKQFEKILGISEPTVAKYNLRGLVALENERRTKEEPTRPHLGMVKEAMDVGVPERVIRNTLRAMEGKVTAVKIAEMSKISIFTVREWWRTLINEENVRRSREEPQRLLIEVNEPEEKIKDGMTSKERIIVALRGMEGLVKPEKLAEKSGLTTQVIQGNDYKALVREENARRVVEALDRKPLQVLTDLKSPLEMLTDTLKTIEGQTSRDDIVSKSGLTGVHILDNHDYRKLIEQENERRKKEESQRPLIDIKGPVVKEEDARILYAQYLRTAEGTVNVKQIAKHFGIQKITTKALRELVDQENHVRQTQEPQRFFVALWADPGQNILVVKDILKRFEGKITKGILIKETGYSDSFFYDANLPKIVDEENERRASENPQQQPLIYRALNMDPKGSLMAALRRMEGPIATGDLEREADVNVTTLKELKYRELINAENERRTKEEPERKKIIPPQEVTKGGLEMAKEALKRMEGEVNMMSIAKEARLNHVSIFNYDYQALVAQENKRRSRDEPKRKPLTVPIAALEVLKNALKVMEGIVTKKRLVEKSGLSTTTIEKYGLKNLVEEENERRKKDEVGRPLLGVSEPQRSTPPKIQKLKINEGIAQIILAMRESGKDVLIETLSALYGDKYSMSQIEEFIERVNSEGTPDAAMANDALKMKQFEKRFQGQNPLELLWAGYLKMKDDLKDRDPPKRKQLIDVIKTMAQVKAADRPDLIVDILNRSLALKSDSLFFDELYSSLFNQFQSNPFYSQYELNNGQWNVKSLTDEEIFNWANGKYPLAPGRALRKSIRSNAFPIYLNREEKVTMTIPIQLWEKNIDHVVLASFYDANLGIVLGIFSEKNHEEWVKGNASAVPYSVYALSAKYNKARFTEPFVMDLNKMFLGQDFVVRAEGSPWQYRKVTLDTDVDARGALGGHIFFSHKAFGVSHIPFSLKPDVLRDNNLKKGDSLIVVIRNDANHGPIAEVYKPEDFDFNNPALSKNCLTTYAYVRIGEGKWMNSNLAVMDILGFKDGRRDLVDTGRKYEGNVEEDSSGEARLYVSITAGKKLSFKSFYFTPAEVETYDLLNKDRPISIQLKVDKDYGPYLEIGTQQDGKYEIICTYVWLVEREKHNIKFDLNQMALMDYILGNKNVHGENVDPRVFINHNKISSGSIGLSGKGEVNIARLTKFKNNDIIFVPQPSENYGWVIEVHDYEAYQKDPHRTPEIVMVRDAHRKTLVPIDELAQKSDKNWQKEAEGIAQAIRSPGDLLDALLVIYGDKVKAKKLKEFVRRFRELNLGDINQPGGGGSNKSEIEFLLEFYFQKASLINQKDKRDRDTLAQVFIKLAFRDLMKPETQVPIIQKLIESRNRGVFFEELYELVRELVEDGMVYQSKHIKRQLWPHQSVAAHFLNSHEKAHLGDFTGAGKTLEVLAALDLSWKTFIAVPANLIDNWIKEIGKHFTPEALANTEIVILRGSPEKRRELMLASRLKKNVIIIGSIQSLRGMKAEDLDDLSQGLDLLVVDESQYIQNFRGQDVSTNAQQAEALEKIEANRKWYLSATGYTSNPKQLFALLHALNKGTKNEDQYRDYRTFARLFPVGESAGLRHMRGEMRRLSLARQADEVMDRYEDPSIKPLDQQGARMPNLKEVDYHDLGGYTLNQEQLELLFMMIKDFRKFAQWYNERVPLEDHLAEDNLNAFVKLQFIFDVLIDPRRVGGSSESPIWAAMDRVIDKYKGKKGIIYTNNVYVLEEIMSRYHNLGVARIDGSVQGYARVNGKIVKGYNDDTTGELVIDDHDPRSKAILAKTYQRHIFQNDPNISLIVVNSEAGGVGLDLTAAEYYINAQLPDTYTLDKQLDGRAVRPDPSRPRYMVDKIRMVARFPDDLIERFGQTQYADVARRMVSRTVYLGDFKPLFEKSEEAQAGAEALWHDLGPNGIGLIDNNGFIDEAKFEALEGNPDNLILPDEYKDKRQDIYDILKQARAPGTPAEIQLDRLRKQKNVFEYVMTDLTMPGDLDLFDPQSLASVIPGFMEDPTIEEYYQSMKSSALRRTLQLFLPLYEKTETRERREDILRVAQLFYETGNLGGLNNLINLLGQNDERLMHLLGLMEQIPNKYARKTWVARVSQFLQEELPSSGVQIDDIVNQLDFLQDEAKFLTLPLYQAGKGYDNGATLNTFSELISEIQETYSKKPHYIKMLFQSLSLWLLAVDYHQGNEDARDWLKTVLERHGKLFTNTDIPLQQRLRTLEQLLRSIRYKPVMVAILEQAEEGNFDSFNKALQEGIVLAAQGLFSISQDDVRHLVETFPAVLTAMQMMSLLKNDTRFNREAKQLNENLKHIAHGDYGAWRNQQIGERRFGSTVDFMANDPEFWQEFTKEESVNLDGFEIGFQKHKEQISGLAFQLLETIEGQTNGNENSQDQKDIVMTVDGSWVADKFKQWSQDANSFKKTGSVRKEMATAKISLREGKELTEAQQDALTNEGMDLQDGTDQLIEHITARLESYSDLEDWLNLRQKLLQLTKDVPKSSDIAALKMLLARLMGRSLNVELSGFSDQLESLSALLNHMNEVVRYKKLIVQFTSRPELIIERGMLRPELSNCFNAFGDPKQVSTLVDDLGSRNKILAIVRDEDGRELGVSVVKVKQLQEGVPVIFPEKPLNLRGYNFEHEVLEALKRSKMERLARYGAVLAREGNSNSHRIRIYDTGGYGDKEYFEPLFGIRTRTVKNVYHYGEILPVFSAVPDKAMKGGIDFSANKTLLEIKSSGRDIKFHIDQAMLKRLQNAPGFVPVIINIQPVTNLARFLGLKEKQGALLAA